MSDVLATLIATLLAAEPTAATRQPDALERDAAVAVPAADAAADRGSLRHAVAVAVPTTDAVRGIAVAYERWFPSLRLSASVGIDLRQTASGDYGGMRAGAGAELRWYARARSRWSRQPAGSMVGWFAGTRVDVGGDWLHDRTDDRWLGSTLVVGAGVHVGYRIQPWRRLAITPTVGHAWRVEHDPSGRLGAWMRHGHTAGLTLGWMF